MQVIKNKRFTYILLSCVAMVWGIIFFRIFFAVVAEEEPIAIASLKKTSYFKLVNHEKDRVQLILNYRDPFASYESEAIKELISPKIQGTKSTAKSSEIKNSPIVNWNNIWYAGYINNPVNKQKVAIISVNGTTLMLVEGQTSNQIKLLKFANDSVKLLYEQETKYIKLK